jgi:hypothetical protein
MATIYGPQYIASTLQPNNPQKEEKHCPMQVIMKFEDVFRENDSVLST